MSRAGFVAIIGAPNAGKSTLVNALVGAKVSIVTRKVQTTRFAVRGVAALGESQMVLVDTPGIFAPRRRLDRAMVRAAWAQAADADAVVHLVDAPAQARSRHSRGEAADRRAAADVARVADGLRSSGLKARLALNKVDALPRDQLLPLSQTLYKSDIYTDVFMISARTGSGVEDLKRHLAEVMPEGPWLYPPGQKGDLPPALLAAEITREKLYLRVHEELPYAAGVETTAFETRPDGSLRIEQNLLVEREGQKAILVGKGGETLKWIGQAAREEMSGLLGRSVHLFLTVRVNAGWAERRGLFQETGLEYDS